MSVSGRIPSFEKSKRRVHKDANDQREKTPESRLWIFWGKKLSRKANGRKRAPVGIAHIADASLLHPRDFVRCLQPIFCKRRLKRPILVGLGREVALLDWDERYTVYVHPCGTEIVGVARRDAAMLGRMRRDSYIVMRPYQRNLTYQKTACQRAKIL